MSARMDRTQALLTLAAARCEGEPVFTLPKTPDGKNTLSDLVAFCDTVPDDQILPAIYASVRVIERRRLAGEPGAQLRRWFIVYCLVDRVLYDIGGFTDDPEFAV